MGLVTTCSREVEHVWCRFGCRKHAPARWAVRRVTVLLSTFWISGMRAVFASLSVVRRSPFIKFLIENHGEC